MLAACDSIDWLPAAQTLRRNRFVRLRKSFDLSTCEALVAAAPEPWHDLPPEEGIVRQSGRATGGALAESAPVVRELGDALVSSLSVASPRLAGPPSFNEVTWSLYPEGVGHITAHRDPAGVGGVIAIVTLQGTAEFSVRTSGEHVEWLTEPGDLVLLCGNGWPEDETRCPLHAVGPPVGSDRMILTFRHNKGGAGANYFGTPA